MTALLKIEHFAHWLASGERGISSEAIVSQLTGQPAGRGYRDGHDHPWDPDDFRRCEILLRSHPLAQLVFKSAMPARSEVWARMVEHWDEIAELMESEVPGVFDSWPRGKAAPKAYALMRELRSAA